VSAALHMLNTVTAQGAYALCSGGKRLDKPQWDALRGALQGGRATGLGSLNETHKNWGRWRCLMPARNLLASTLLMQMQLDQALKVALLPIGGQAGRAS
jgi:hypothetical protein